MAFLKVAPVQTGTGAVLSEQGKIKIIYLTSIFKSPTYPIEGKSPHVDCAQCKPDSIAKKGRLIQKGCLLILHMAVDNSSSVAKMSV